LIVLMLLLLGSSSSSLSPLSPVLLSCADIALLPRNEPFAHGAMKAVEHTTLLDGTPVVVARPHEKALKRFLLSVQHAMTPERALWKAKQRYASLWSADRDLLLSLRAANDSASFVPLLYGACWDDGYESLALVLEPLRNGVDVLLDATLTLRQRARLALSSLAVLRHLDSVPLSPTGPRRTCVYSDVHAQQFGVTADYGVKLLDVDSKDFHCVERGRRLNDSIECHEADACFKHFSGDRGMFGRLWQATLGGVGQSRQYPTEFACNINTHRCIGLDAGVNLYAMCVMWLRHLLVSVPEQLMGVAADDPFLVDARKVIDECSRRGAARRFTEPELRWALERLEATHFGAASAAEPLPPLSIENKVDFNKAKRDLLRLEIPPRANATELAIQLQAAEKENAMLIARIRQLERELQQCRKTL
jgi:hypothetical protein